MIRWTPAIGYQFLAVTLFAPWLAQGEPQAHAATSPGFADVLRRAEQARQRAQDAFRAAGGATLLGLDATSLRP